MHPPSSNSSARPSKKAGGQPNGEPSFPPGFIDALLKYAMDPTQWENLANELNHRRSSIDQLDPSSFLTLLSQAESLAWHMHSQPPTQLTGCAYFLINDRGKVVYASDQTNQTAALLSLADERLHFHSDVSRTNFESALASLRSGSKNQVLVELLTDHHASYGYLIPAESIPAHFAQTTTPAYAFVVALREPSDQVTQVLQASFHLTAAEISVCHRLCAGLALKEVAEELEISTNTARNHLQAVFEKTGLNRQSDLILMMTQLSVVLAVVSGQSYEEEETPASDYPSHRFAITTDNRKIAYRIYGTGNRKVVYYHESAGSSRLLPGTAKQASERDLQIIAIERPGSGFSDPVNGYDFDVTCADTITVLEHLKFDAVDLVGFMSGAGHALRTAIELGPRVRSLFLISGRAPQPYPEGETNPLALLRYGLMNRPWLLNTFFNILRTRATPAVVRSTLLQVYGSVPHDKQLLLDNEDFLHHMVGYVMETMTVSGAGISGEIQCFTRPTDLDLSQVNAPVTVWHGEQDTISPWPTFKAAIDQLNPTYRLFPANGSLILLEYWQEILDTLAQTDETEEEQGLTH